MLAVAKLESVFNSGSKSLSPAALFLYPKKLNLVKMVFKCQTDSFLKEFVTKVVKIENVEDKVLVNFEDTILFPEGGGQPTDHGTIVVRSEVGESKLEVVNVIRKGPEAIHYIEKAGSEIQLKVGDEVVQHVNWERRHDHMQQHSGQHLISALFEKEYNYNTRAWWLGAESSYIEIDGKTINDAEMQKIERMCNRYIAQALPVNVQIYETADCAGDEVSRASRGLPLDLSGPIRVINIEGIDSNMCCGTHVKNLAQLQVIKLMNIERTKGKTFVHFLVGDRVVKKLDSTFQRELQFNLLLNGGAESHIDLVKKLQASLKASQKTVQKLSKEVAIKVAEELNANPNPGDFFSLHKSDGVDVDFANTFLRTIKVDKNIFFFITIADGIDSKSGSLIIQGHPEDITALADPICKLLNGKGNGKNNRYQAKVLQLNKVKDCETLIKNHFADKTK